LEYFGKRCIVSCAVGRVAVDDEGGTLVRRDVVVRVVKKSSEEYAMFLEYRRISRASLRYQIWKEKRKIRKKENAI
jgi:hypothetical protein